MTKSEISKKLKSTRENQKISHYEINKSTVLGRSTLQNIEAPDGNPTLNSLLVYSNYLGLKIEITEE